MSQGLGWDTHNEIKEKAFMFGILLDNSKYVKFKERTQGHVARSASRKNAKKIYHFFDFLVRVSRAKWRYPQYRYQPIPKEVYKRLWNYNYTLIKSN